MDKKVFLKSILPLVISLSVAIIFFVSYNQYLLDRSLSNLKMSLRQVEKVKDIRDVHKIKSILEDTLLMEITREDLDPASLVKIEFSGYLAGLVSKNEQSADIGYFLKSVVEKKEAKRNPLLVAIDNFIAKFMPKRHVENVKAIKNRIEHLKKELSLYTGEVLQSKYFEIGLLSLRIKMWESARNFFSSAVKTSPNNQTAQKAKLYEALAFKFEGKYEQAKEILMQLKGVLSKELNSFSSYEEGDCLYRQGKVDEAAVLFKEAFEKDPSLEVNQLAQFRVGYIFLYDKEDQQRAYEEFLKLQALNVDASGYLYRTEGLEKIYKGHMEPIAIASFSRIVTHLNASVIPTIAKQFRDIGFKLLAEGYGLLRKDNLIEAQGKFKEALEKFDLALKFYPSDAYSHGARGLIFYFLGNKEEAILMARRAVELAPNNPVLLANLGFIFYNVGMLNDAISQYKKAILFLKDSAFLNYNMGTIYLIKNEPLKAVQHLEEAIRLNPRFPYSYNNLGYLLWLKGSYREAKVNLEKAVSLKEDYVDAHYNLGVVFFYLGDFEKSLEKFMLVQRLKPNHKQVNWFLSQIQEKIPVQ